MRALLLSFFVLSFVISDSTGLRAMPRPQDDCAWGLKNLRWFNLHKLEGQAARDIVRAFSLQGRPKVQLFAANHEVRQWLNDFWSYSDRMKAFEPALMRTKVRIELMEKHWLGFEKVKDKRIKLPHPANIKDGWAITPGGLERVGEYLSSRSAARRLLESEIDFRKELEGEKRHRREQQAILYLRFSLILANRMKDERPNYVAPDQDTAERLRLLDEIESVMDPGHLFADELHPDPEILSWAERLFSFDRSYREFKRRSGIQMATTGLDKVNNAAQKVDDLHKKKFTWLIALAAVVGSGTFALNQIVLLREQTTALSEKLEKTVLSEEELKKEAIEKEKRDRFEKLLGEAKVIAEKTESWEELETRFATFMGHFPAESGIIWGEVKSQARADFQPDGSVDPFYFKAAEEIELWWSRIQKGYELEGKVLIYGAKGRFEIRKKSRDLLRGYFDQLEKQSSKP